MHHIRCTKCLFRCIEVVKKPKYSASDTVFLPGRSSNQLNVKPFNPVSSYALSAQVPSLQVTKVYFWGGSGREPLQFFFIQTGVWDYANYSLEPCKL